MGCRQSTVIPVTSVETSHKCPEAFKKEEVKAMHIVKTATEEDIDTKRQKQTEKKVLQQLQENDTLKKSYISTGGVAYNIGLQNEHNSNNMLVIPACPERIVKRLEKPKASYFSPEERNLMADILKKHELTSKGEKARVITEKQEMAKQRREERQRKINEKFERKRKLTEERLKKLRKKRKEKLDEMTGHSSKLNCKFRL